MLQGRTRVEQLSHLLSVRSKGALLSALGPALPGPRNEGRKSFPVARLTEGLSVPHSRDLARAVDITDCFRAHDLPSPDTW